MCKGQVQALTTIIEYTRVGGSGGLTIKRRCTTSLNLQIVLANYSSKCQTKNVYKVRTSQPWLAVQLAKYLIDCKVCDSNQIVGKLLQKFSTKVSFNLVTFICSNKVIFRLKRRYLHCGYVVNLNVIIGSRFETIFRHDELFNCWNEISHKIQFRKLDIFAFCE